MSSAEILELGDYLPQAPRWRMPRWIFVAPIVLALAIAIGIAAPWQSTRGEAAVKVALDKREIAQLKTMTDGEQAAPLEEGDLARLGNDKIPFAAASSEVVPGFAGIAADKPAYGTALRCLTEAIYYEAANESVAGRKAVAQVVLNRMRHPAFPNSVCGVVYQGANQKVCQFSFTCDGSLLRKPMAEKWAEARAIAVQALAGATEPSVGSATYYHADYVLPRWAYTLLKTRKIGAHIFYRYPGTAGRVAILNQQWSGGEHIPQLDWNRLRIELAERDDANVQPEPEFVPGLTVTHDVKDRHAEADVGGRLDTTKQWRLTIPDPVEANSAYRATVAGQSQQVAANDVLDTPGT